MTVETIATTQATAPAGHPYNEVVPGAVLEATKTGLVVSPDRSSSWRYLRDQQGYDYCSMVTSIDWPQYFEVVYQLYGVAARRPADLARPAHRQG